MNLGTKSRCTRTKATCACWKYDREKVSHMHTRIHMLHFQLFSLIIPSWFFWQHEAPIIHEGHTGSGFAVLKLTGATQPNDEWVISEMHLQKWACWIELISAAMSQTGSRSSSAFPALKIIIIIILQFITLIKFFMKYIWSQFFSNS